MGKEEKTLLATIGIALAILWIFKPKKSANSKEDKKDDVLVEKYQAPKVVEEDEKKLKDEAVVGLQAMRQAINDGQPARELDKLKNMILQENRGKLMKRRQRRSQRLRADIRNRKPL